MKNNPLSFSSIKLDLFSREGANLKSASGFVVEADNQHYLITNWHILSGRDIFGHEASEVEIKPHTLKTSLHIYGGDGENSFPLSWGQRKKIAIQLYDDSGAPQWIEGRADKQNQRMADVVALPIQLDLNFANLVSRNFLRSDSDTNFWAKISAIPVSAIDTDVEYGPPDPVYIIGYPLGWAPTGMDKSSAAFWRTSSIASEIDEISLAEGNAFFIDPCGLEGMAGSPVIGMKNDRTKLLGVYSDSSTAEYGANAGLVWNACLVKELLGIS